MKAENNHLLLRLCCYASMAICFMPVVDYYCPWYVTMIPAVAVIGISLTIDQKITAMLKVLLYITGLALLLFWYTKRRDPATTYFINFYITFLPTLLAVQLGRTIQDKHFFKDYLFVMTLIISITCITTMIGHEQYPMASRELASGSAIYDTDIYLRMNIGGYDFIYGLVLLIPLFWWMRNRETSRFRKIVYTVALVLDVLCIYSSQYTIALICVVVTFLMIWMLKNRKNASIATAILIVFLLCNGLDLLSQLFRWASQHIGMDYVSDRLMQVSQLLGGHSINTGTSDKRIMHYKEQLATFSHAPLFGKNIFDFTRSAVSGHSLILDIMGAGGVFATGLLVLLFRGLYKTSVLIPGKGSCSAVRVIWATAAVIAVLNPITFTMAVTIAFPCCMCIEHIEHLDKGEI